MKRMIFELAIVMTAGFFIGLTLPLNNTVISLTAIFLTYVLGISMETFVMNVMKKDKEKDKEKSITQVMAEIKKARKKKKKHGTSNN